MAAKSLSDIHYYHGTLSRDDTEKLLFGKDDGTFVLRKSVRRTNCYVISVTFKNECLHYSVSENHRDGRVMYSVNNGTPYSTPWEVCEHYKARKGGLKVRLVNPVYKLLAYDNSPYLMETKWFHDDITREEDSLRLSQGYRMNRSNGIFLIRKKEDNKYVLSLVNGGRVHRYIIHQMPTNSKFYISGIKNEFKDLSELVEFNSANPPSVTGIQCQLTTPCPKVFKQRSSVTVPVTPLRPPLNRPSVAPTLAIELERILPAGGFDIVDEVSQPLTKRTLIPEKRSPPSLEKRKWLREFASTSKSEPEKCPGYNSIYQNLAQNAGEVALDLFVEENNISIYEELGKGHFGKVCLGRCQIAGITVTCAVKFLSGGDVTSNKKELLTEAGIMQKLDHPHIIRLIAMCDTGSKLIMLLELAPMGTLKMFLKQQNETTITEVKILNIMNQILHGMNYLASKNIVHRDLAARNILLVSENFAKVSDFGMSKVLRESENYYKSAKPGKWPLKWYSPEALCYYKFTSKCDVWSYGVTLWEAFSYGCRPYQGMKGREVLEMIERNERLDCPIACPPEVYNLMLNCWIYDHDQRPDFEKLIPVMESICENMGSSGSYR